MGHLQSNKCRDAAGLFEMVQGVDSLQQAQESTTGGTGGATVPILLEVNAGAEASKFGYRPDRLLGDFGRINALPRLEIHGLMTVPPWAPTGEGAAGFRQIASSRSGARSSWALPCPT